MPSVYAVIHLDELYVMWPKVLVCLTLPLDTVPVLCKLVDHFQHVSRECNSNQGGDIVRLLSLQVQKAENLCDACKGWILLSSKVFMYASFFGQHQTQMIPPKCFSTQNKALNLPVTMACRPEKFCSCHVVLRNIQALSLCFDNPHLSTIPLASSREASLGEYAQLQERPQLQERRFQQWGDRKCSLCKSPSKSGVQSCK